MKTIKKFLIMLFSVFIASSFILNCASQKKENAKLLAIDTAGDPKYSYRTVLELMQAYNYDIDFKHFYDLKNVDPAQYDGAILFCSPEFIINSNHHLVKKTVHKLFELASLDNKLISIFIPQHMNYIEKSQIFFKTLLFDILMAVEGKTKKRIEPILDAYLSKALQHDNKIEKNYGTLLSPHFFENVHELYIPVHAILPDKTILATTLPLSSKNIPEKHQSILPLGFTIHNPKTQSSFFLAKIGQFSYADPQENFWLTPVDKKIREQLITMCSTTIRDMLAIHTGQDKKMSAPVIPKKLTTSYMAKEKEEESSNRLKNAAKQYKWIDENKIAAGWMDIETYKDKELSAAKNIFDANLNLLWITFNPEWYLSKQAQRASRKDSWLATTEKFTKELKKLYQMKDKKFPHIFVGIDLTNNFNKAPVVNSVKDIYGKDYTKIPAPLDYKSLWEPECVEPLKQFVDTWNRRVGNGIPLSGVFFDLEMYHAPHQAGTYKNIMDFSDIAWSSVEKDIGQNACSNTTHKDRVACLYDHNLMDKYFEKQKNNAYQLGQKIYRKLNSIIPDCMIGIYNMGLPTERFYQGLLAGMNSPQKPLIYASFNNDFYSHYKWLKKQNIHAYHAPAFLMSKLRTEEDFDKIPVHANGHDGIWFNRFSWLVKDYNPAAWYFAEETSLPADTVVKNIKIQVANLKTM